MSEELRPCPFCGGAAKVMSHAPFNYWVRCKDCEDDCFLENVQLKDIQLMAAAPEMLELLRETKHALLVIYHQLWARNMGDFGAQEQADKIDTFLSRIETGGME